MIPEQTWPYLAKPMRIIYKERISLKYFIEVYVHHLKAFASL